MALEHIIAALEQESAAQSAAIRAQAKAEAATLLEGSEAACTEMRAHALEAVQPRLRIERSRRINLARLDAQRITLGVQEALVDAVYEACRVQLAQARHRSDYAALLSALVDEVIEALGTPLLLEIDTQDAELLHGFLRDRHDSVSVRPGIQTWGGVIGHTSDGRITVDNTLETRFSQAQERHRGKVAGLLNEVRPNAG